MCINCLFKCTTTTTTTLPMWYHLPLFSLFKNPTFIRLHPLLDWIEVIPHLFSSSPLGLQKHISWNLIKAYSWSTPFNLSIPMYGHVSRWVSLYVINHENGSCLALLIMAPKKRSNWVGCSNGKRNWKWGQSRLGKPVASWWVLIFAAIKAFQVWVTSPSQKEEKKVLHY